MPRFSLQSLSTQDFDDESGGELDGIYDHVDNRSARRRSRSRERIPTVAPQIRIEGRSGRALVDVDLIDNNVTASEFESAGPVTAEETPYSSYDVATHGPKPVPDWVVTELSARDTRLGALKSGKEADVGLLERALPNGPGCLLAVKTYRDSAHRMFHRDSGYQEGRRTRRSRETRAMAKRTGFGRELLAGKWASAEFGALTDLWKLGVRVPYPVQLIGSELMMQFIGDPDGTAAPRLAAIDSGSADFTELWQDLVLNLETLADQGLTHGDLSPYNVLVHEDTCWLIDLPQVVDVIGNPQGDFFLERDCQVIADFFARRGVAAANGDLLALHLGGIARGV